LSFLEGIASNSCLSRIRLRLFGIFLAIIKLAKQLGKYKIIFAGGRIREQKESVRYAVPNMQASAICSHVKKHLFAESQLTFLSDKENYLRDAASHIANRKSSIYRRRNAAHAMTVNLVEREILYYCLWCAVETSRTLHSEFASPKSDHYTCKSTSSLIRLRLVILKRKRKDLLLSIGNVNFFMPSESLRKVITRYRQAFDFSSPIFSAFWQYTSIELHSETTQWTNDPSKKRNASSIC